MQTPEYRNDSLTALQNTPLFARASAPGGFGPGALTLLSSVATITRQPTQTVINHVNTQPTFNVYAAVQTATSARSPARSIDIVAEEQKALPAPDKITVRGQIENMRSAFFRLGIGLGIALIAVYLLMAVNYQSWGDPSWCWQPSPSPSAHRRGPVHHQHRLLDPLAVWGDHVGGHRVGELDPARHLRQGTPGGHRLFGV